MALLWPTGLRKLVRVVDTLKGEDGAIRLGAADYLVKPFEAAKHADMDPNNSPEKLVRTDCAGRPRLTRLTEGPNLSATRHGSDASCLVPYQEPALARQIWCELCETCRKLALARPVPQSVGICHRIGRKAGDSNNAVQF